MMQISVSGLLKSSLGSKLDCQVSDLVNITGSDSPVEGEVWLTRTDRGILLKARLNTKVEVTCSRCLGLFSFPMIVDFEEEYFPVIDIVIGSSLSLPDEPGCFTIDEHHVLDLTEAVRQYALLAIPMKPLCRKGCAGLCLICGRDLNQGACGCLPQGPDRYWSKLGNFILRNDG